MNNLDLGIILLTVKIALISTILVTIFSLILAWKLKRANLKIKNTIEMLINISLFISPSVLGYILILILGKNGFIGSILYRYFNITVMFSWWAGIITSFVVTLPLMYNSIKAGMENLSPMYYEAGLEAGASEFQILRLITIPLIKKNILAGILLSFGRAMGEFGATLMLAGNIPGKTQTISMAIYSASESGDSGRANFFLIVILVISFLVMILYNYLFFKERKNI
ncbi:Molybdenum transport system permease protein ModB [Fusobacterium sp. DD29]|uniref:molybdate ABC transporter permease subunit n=1 Tax=unclassified Fusobacterium TaxID=2648384 RepID=UPI001B8C66D0|nr:MULTISPECIES: molybdate ABC transporter permease subunit [unclassified Fusobacterium]MBR8702296.1 Molybdenum transport system permease protein ModB [Fusobacterium sp. DD45]MBR8712113.1 Molybdenum transport system permease protein ModB [Fusobacterium sp. DD28]MBR8750497.1 Molybdenum transport system permease protein ModB [Fusobacterium sp. DD29]MBR8752692.1 Molybdenum transport system permease protein ModB [Fusobacterium sp. DD26]MBR8762743.1 Molybdenum transport system permease protein ModB